MAHITDDYKGLLEQAKRVATMRRELTRHTVEYAGVIHGIKVLLKPAMNGIPARFCLKDLPWSIVEREDNGRLEYVGICTKSGKSQRITIGATLLEVISNIKNGIFTGEVK